MEDAKGGEAVWRARVWLQAEGAAVLIGSLVAYQVRGEGWLLFALLLLLPDLFMVGYLRGPRVGALAYNLAHTYLAPIALLAGWWFFGHQTLLTLGIIWTAHIGLDRMMGYGLKAPTGFKHTHIHHG